MSILPSSAASSFTESQATAKSKAAALANQVDSHSKNIFHLPIDAAFRRRYSVPIILVLNDELRTIRPASPSRGFELARKDVSPLTAQPSEPWVRQSNRMYRPQAARAAYRLGLQKSNGGK
jgi:hypothetical protein